MFWSNYGYTVPETCGHRSIKKPLLIKLCFTRRQILDSSKLKEFADDNFKFDENGIKISRWVENTAGKGEIARYEQFLLFPQCFQKACFQGVSKGVLVWEWLNSLVVLASASNILLRFYKTWFGLMTKIAHSFD